jgi:hypothetical protein
MRAHPGEQVVEISERRFGDTTSVGSALLTEPHREFESRLVLEASDSC